MNSKLLNINVGVMGHVDSGKTALCKCLSDKSSTAAFDKSPQSQQRGITLDLGFSSFTSEVTSHENLGTAVTMQITLVDCPGHASLFKTVIGGSKIIDMILLVIDINRGIQNQTAECIVLADVLKKPVIIAMNKVDLIDESERSIYIKKEINKLRKILSTTFLENANIIPVSSLFTNFPDSPYYYGVLKNAITTSCPIPVRSDQGIFLFAVDHCFGIKGQGTVMTGTVIQGSIKVNDEILIVDHKISKQVKSIQVFKQNIEKISQGDRAGICVSRFEAKLLERGLISSPKTTLKLALAAVIRPEIIKHYKKDINSYSKVSVSIGFDVVTSSILLFEDRGEFSLENDYYYIPTINSSVNQSHNCLCLIKFERPIVFIDDSIVLGVKLSMESKKNSCRIMFHGSCVNIFNSEEYKNVEKKLKIYSLRTKNGIIDRVFSNQVIVKNLLSAKTSIDKHVGKEINFSTGDKGVIDSKFGTSGRIKVRIDIENASDDLKKLLNTIDIRKSENNITVTYLYKKYRKISLFS